LEGCLPPFRDHRTLSGILPKGNARPG
jgi:hypothetical protein